MAAITVGGHLCWVTSPVVGEPIWSGGLGELQRVDSMRAWESLSLAGKGLGWQSSHPGRVDLGAPDTQSSPPQ